MTPRRPLAVRQDAVIAGRVSDRGIDDLGAQVAAGIAGLKERLAGMDQKVTPVTYIGGYGFKPESASFALDVDQQGIGTQLVNYVVRSGVTYQIPVNVGGDGIFLAHAIRCVVRQRFYVGLNGVKAPAQMTMAPMVNNFNNVGTPVVNWTTKFSLYPEQPIYNQTPAIHYRWNLQDLVSGVMYSDELIPSCAILNRTWLNSIYSVDGDQFNADVVIPDGDWHEFDSPWAFRQGQQVIFQFRPLTDVVQFDSTISGQSIGLTYDDRENGVRNQAVTVKVELIGERIGGS